MWVKLCERIGSHPKLLCVGAEAAWLWVTSIAYANAHVTNGVLPKKALRAFFPTDDWTPTKLRGLADRLVEAGLWEETGGDSWQIHDYAVYQAEAMSERVERKREWERDRKAIQRAGKRGNPNARVIADLNHLSHRDTTGTTPGLSQGLVPPNVPRLSRHVPVVSRGTDPIRSGTEGHSNARTPPPARTRGASLSTRTPKPRSHTHGVEVGREGPSDALEPTGRPEVAPAPSEAAEGPATGRRDTIPPLPEPEAPAATPQTPTRPAAHALRDSGFVDPEAEARTAAFRAYMAAEWPDKVDSLTTAGQFAEYVGDNFRTASKGVFQPTASATLLVAFGHAIVAEKLTRQEVREMAQVLLRQSREVFAWDKHGAGAGGFVSLSMLLGKATGSGGYEARPFASLCAFTRKRIADRAAKAQEAAASRPATVPALPHQEPAVVSGEILAQAKRMRDQLAAAAAEKRAEVEKRRAALGLDQVQPRVDRDSLDAAYADVPMLHRRAV
jgi:hypothetical protein